MNEIFFDEVGELFSDGQTVKFSLRSVHPRSRGESLQDVALLVCKPATVPNLVKLLTDFMTSQSSCSGEREAIEDTSDMESSLSLGHMRNPH